MGKVWTEDGMDVGMDDYALMMKLNLGAMILVGMITELFENFKEIAWKDKNNYMANLERYQYFIEYNDDFITRFATAEIDEYEGVGAFFYDLFQGGDGIDHRNPEKKIRRHIEQASAVSQCQRALGQTAADVKNQNDYCYF